MTTVNLNAHDEECNTKTRQWHRGLLFQPIVMAVFCAVLLSAASCGLFETRYTIPTVVKLVDTPWFDRMEEGIDRFKSETGHNSYMVGPPRADALLQVQIVEDLIESGVDAITVVPSSPETLDPVLEKALERGLVVITHEASDQQHCTYDLEAFDNREYGEHLMDGLAECMGEEGAYVVFVGNLASRTHNEWADAAIAHQKANYPEMELSVSRIESLDDLETAYQKAVEILDKYSGINGFLGSAAVDVAGIGRAISERGLDLETCVVGTSLPSISGELLRKGSVDLISYWDPAEAGYAMNVLATRLLNGQGVNEGDDLGANGYQDIRIEGSVIYGDAWIDVAHSSVAKDNF